MLNIGFVGLGGMGMGQVRAFSQVKGVRIAAGADPFPGARDKFKEQFPDAETFPDYKALLKSNNVDALVVVTPTLHHKDVCIAAMKSGRPVLTEKPMARTVADCHKMLDLSEKTKKLLMVAHCRRFDTDWGAWGKLVTAGRIGRPVLFRHVNANLISFGGPWFMDHKLSGGPLMDGAIHNYDYGNSLFGDPDEVLASEIKLTKKTAIDTGTAVVRYKSGDQIMVCWSWGITSSSMIDVIGPRGSINWGPGDLPTDKYDREKHGFYTLADEPRKNKKLVAFKRSDMYVTQAKHFVDCVAGKAKCVTPGEEAIKAVAVAETILKAAPKGRSLKVRW
jgi:predicted dehydrogenase